LRLSVQQLNEWQSKFEGKINFLLVYIAEAHANDVWPLGKHVDLPSHQTINDRQKAAMILVNKFGCKVPILLDTMEDQFDTKFAVWPERYYIVKSQVMEHLFYPSHEFGFDHNEMLAKLQAITATRDPVSSQ